VHAYTTPLILQEVIYSLLSGAQASFLMLRMSGMDFSCMHSSLTKRNGRDIIQILYSNWIIMLHLSQNVFAQHFVLEIFRWPDLARRHGIMHVTSVVGSQLTRMEMNVCAHPPCWILDNFFVQFNFDQQ
jgi:hypothetical protein